MPGHSSSSSPYSRGGKTSRGVDLQRGIPLDQAGEEGGHPGSLSFPRVSISPFPIVAPLSIKDAEPKKKISIPKILETSMKAVAY